MRAIAVVAAWLRAACRRGGAGKRSEARQKRGRAAHPLLVVVLLLALLARPCGRRRRDRRAAGVRGDEVLRGGRKSSRPRCERAAATEWLEGLQLALERLQVIHSNAGSCTMPAPCHDASSCSWQPARSAAAAWRTHGSMRAPAADTHARWRRARLTPVGIPQPSQILHHSGYHLQV